MEGETTYLEDDAPVINATHEQTVSDEEMPDTILPSVLPKARILEVAVAISDFVRPYVGRSVVSLAPKAQLSDIDGVTLAVVCPVGSQKGKLRNGLVESAYTYEIGILRLLREGDELEECVATTEAISAALLSTGILPCDVEISNVENAFLDTDLVRRRRQFTAVLTVEVSDCLLMEPDGLK